MTLSLTDRAGAEIRAHMGRKRLSQSQLADQLGWSDMKLSRILRGETSPRLADIEQIAQELDVPATQLLAAGDGQV